MRLNHPWGVCEFSRMTIGAGRRLYCYTRLPQARVVPHCCRPPHGTGHRDHCGALRLITKLPLERLLSERQGLAGTKAVVTG